MVELVNVGVRYKDNVVYSGFNFTFGNGVNVVLGKSGCGKTTLLNVIADLVDYSGTCKIDGPVAFVFQQPCLAPVSVWKNVDAVLPRGDHTEKIQEVLQAVGLADKGNTPVRQLSGGEQQRVSLARAFASGRKIMLLDEPFSNLDYGTKVGLRQIFADLVQSDTTVVFVTHDIDDALALADTVYLLQDRPCTLTQVAQISTPRKKRNEYAPEQVALKQKLQQLLV